MTENFWIIVGELKGKSLTGGQESLLPVGTVRSVTDEDLAQIEESIEAKNREIDRVMSYKEDSYQRTGLSNYTL
jgi:hypothetical protein